ncbi:MAG TPA: phosphotransferase [bacterium]|nr:phosphotransferase [bacterium]
MQPVAEVSVSPSQARSLVTAQFPSLAGQRVTLAGEGWDNTAYRVGRDWVFRFPRRAVGAGCLEHEIAVMPAVAARLDLPVSHAELVGEPTAGFPWRFAGHRWLPGRTSCSVRLDDDARGRLARPLGRFLAQLHAIDADTARSLGAPEDEHDRVDPGGRVPRARQRIEQLVAEGLLPEAGPWFDALDDAATRTGSLRPASALVHGDLYARHLLVGSGGESAPGALLGVIDWGDVHAGEPALDLAIVDLMLPPGPRAAFFDDYGTPDPATRSLARVRAIGHAAATGLWAHEVRDEGLLDASRWALGNALLADG